MIKDSGNRQEFDTGAVRDIQKGKGRCDLLPLDVVAEFFAFEYGIDNAAYKIFSDIAMFVDEGHPRSLYGVIEKFIHEECGFGQEESDMLLEVSRHFEEGAEKYGENNWQKGLPTNCYINSAIRHYLKWMRGDDDEPHDRAFVWNILCCIWTCIHKPELNSYAKGGEQE